MNRGVPVMQSRDRASCRALARDARLQQHARQIRADVN
jgi:hypothetical protein